MTAWRAAAVALAAVLAGLPAGGQDAPAKREGLKELAADLAAAALRVATKLDQLAVRVGYFTPLGIDHGNAGAGLTAELATALGAKVNPEAVLELSGDFMFVDAPNREGVKDGMKALRVKAKLVNLTTGVEVKEFPAFVGLVRVNGDIAKLLGATVAFKDDREYTGSPERGRNKDLQDALPPGPGKSPAVPPAVTGTLVRAVGGDYAVEVRKKPLGDAGPARPVPVELVNGLAFAAVGKGQVYEVRAVNQSDHEVAVSLAVDGIDQFTFSDDRVTATDATGKDVSRPRFSHWVVGPGKDVVIPGWHKTADPGRSDNALSFLVTEYGKGAASQFPTQAQGKVGLITVGFARSYPPGATAPRSATETGFGPPVRLKQEEVRRQIEPAHAFVTVRYAR